MKRSKFLSLVLLAVLVALAACQQNGPAPAPTAGQATQAVFAPVVGEGNPTSTSESGTGGQAYPPAEMPPAVTTDAAPPAEEAYPAPVLPVLPSQAAGIPAGSVTITTSDGVKLAGTVSGNGHTGVILAHMFGGSQNDWKPLADVLVSDGYTVLAIDFRGFGQTGGQQDLKNLNRDLVAAADFLEANGITRVICIGASMGGTACASAAKEMGAASLVVISSPLDVEKPLAVTEESLKDLGIPKLFIAAREDTFYAADVQQMYDWSAGPRQIEILEGSAHGTNLLSGDQGETVQALIQDFLIRMLE